MKFSANRIDITPEIGLPMEGFGDRKGVSDGIHDPVWCSTLAISDDDKTILFLVLDLIAVDTDTLNLIRARISKELSIKPEYIQVICTHTHSGPAGFRKLANISKFEKFIHELEKTKSDIIAKILEISETTINSLLPMKVKFGFAERDGIASNRIDPKMAMDNTISVFSLWKEEANPYSVVTHFTCHPTVLNYKNRSYSSDFPFYVREYIQSKFNEVEMTPIFINGACGDVSTRHTRKGSGFDEAKRVGNLIGESAVKAIDNSMIYEGERLHFKQEIINVKTKELMSFEEAELEYQVTLKKFNDLASRKVKANLLRNAETEFQGARANLKLVKGKVPEKIAVEVNVIGIGDQIAFVTIPGELFVQLGLVIKQRSPFKHTLIIGYANGFLGYFPTAESYEIKSYESRRTLFPLGTGEEIADKINDLLLEIYRTNRSLKRKNTRRYLL